VSRALKSEDSSFFLCRLWYNNPEISSLFLRLDELKNDGWDLVAGKAALSKSFSALVMDVG